VTAVEAVVEELGLTVASSRTNQASRTREIVIR
jgi:hypothetical protein